MNTQIVTVLAGVSSALGFLSLLAYFYLVSQTRRAERSVRETVEGEGLFNPTQVLEILKQFSDDRSRLEALAHLTSLDQNKATAILQKIKAGVDVSQLQRLTYRHYISWAGLVGGVLLLLGIIGIFTSWEKQELDSPTTVSPRDGVLLNHFPRTLELSWEPVRGSRSYVVQVEVQDPSSSTWHVHPFGFGQRTVNDTQLEFEFIGSQPGRWRVAAVSEKGDQGRFSNWSYFEFRDKKPEITEESTNAQGSPVAGSKLAAQPDVWASETKLAKRDKSAVGFTLIKRGAEPELLSLLRPEESGDVTDTRDPGWPDHYVTETFFEFPLTESLRKAAHVELRFGTSRTSAATYACNVGHYAGSGTVDVRRFGASSPLARIELTKDSFEIDITKVVKQYSKEGASFIGFRFYNPEAAKDLTKQLQVLGGRLEAR